MKQEFIVIEVKKDIGGEKKKPRTSVYFVAKGTHKKWKIDNHQFTGHSMVYPPYKVTYPKFMDICPGDTIWLDLSIERNER